MVVAVVHKDGQRPVEQRRGNQHIVRHLIPSHVTHYKLKAAGRSHHIDRLLPAHVQLQSQCVARIPTGRLSGRSSDRHGVRGCAVDGACAWFTDGRRPEMARATQRANRQYNRKGGASEEADKP